jgi:cholesterol transport system auxiliary component
MKKISVIIVFLFLLSGCMPLSPVKTEPPSTYVLTDIRSQIRPVVTTKPTSLTMLVSTPKAAGGYESPRMLYQDRAYQLSHFTKNRWADAPARMLAPLMLQTLQSTRHFQGVVSAPYTGDTDLRLDTELVSFYQDFLQKPSQMRMVLVAQLLNVRTHKVLAARQFEFAEPAPSDDPYGGVIAANRLMGKFLPALAAFSIRRD